MSSRFKTLKKLVSSLVFQLVGALCSMLITMLLVRMGAGYLGVYSVVISTVTIIATFSKIGLDNLSLKVVEKRNTIINRSFLVFGLTVIGISSIVLVVVISLVDSFFVIDILKQQLIGSKALIIIISLVVLFGLTDFLEKFVRSLGKFKESLLPKLVIRPLVFCIALALAYYKVIDLSKTGVLYFLLASYCLVVAFYLIRVIPELRQRDLKVVRNVIPTSTESKSWLKVGFFFLLTGGAQTLFKNLDIILIGQIRDLTEVEYYQGAVKLNLIFSFFLNSVIYVVAPNVSSLLKKGELNKLNRQLSTSKWLVFLVSGISVLVLWILGDLLLGQLYDASFVEARYAFRWLLIGNFISAICGPVGVMLNLSGFEKRVSLVEILAVTFNIILNILLIPVYGYLGAAITTCGVLILRNFYLLHCLNRQVGIYPSIIKFSAK